MRKVQLISIGLILCLIGAVQIAVAPSPSSITVVSPNGGENWVPGTTQTIRWTYAGDVGSTVTIEAIKGTAVLKTLSGVPAGSGGAGSFSLAVPSNTPIGTDYTIRITSTIDPGIVDTSDSAFSVADPITALTVLQKIVTAIQSGVAELWGNATEQQSAIQSEITVREAADNALQGQIDAIPEAGTMVHFGEWSGPCSCSLEHYNRSVHQAETDGFVITHRNPGNLVWGYTGSDPDAPTYRVQDSGGSITMPVRKGDYWEVVAAGMWIDPSDAVCPTVYWIPLTP